MVEDFQEYYESKHSKPSGWSIIIIVILIGIILLLLGSCKSTQYTETNYNGKVVYYYTQSYEDYKLKYDTYNPTNPEIKENTWLYEREESDTIYVIRQKHYGGNTSFYVADQYDIENIKEKDNE